MPTWKKNIFVRVITRRVTKEGIAAEEILAGYPTLTAEEKQEILAAIVVS